MHGKGAWPWRRGAALLGALAMLMAVALGDTASASRLSASHTEFGVIWTPTFTNAFGEVHCEQITLAGSFHTRSFPKVAGALVGFITGAAIREPARCSGGTASVLTERLPWHFIYASFAGTLPRIERITFRIVGLTIGMTASGQACLYRSSSEASAAIIANVESGGAVASVRSDETVRIPFLSGGGLCGLATNARISGSGGGVENPVRFTLI